MSHLVPAAVRRERFFLWNPGRCQVPPISRDRLWLIWVTEHVLQFFYKAVASLFNNSLNHIWRKFNSDKIDLVPKSQIENVKGGNTHILILILVAQHRVYWTRAPKHTLLTFSLDSRPTCNDKYLLNAIRNMKN